MPEAIIDTSPEQIETDVVEFLETLDTGLQTLRKSNAGARDKLAFLRSGIKDIDATLTDLESTKAQLNGQSKNTNTINDAITSLAALKKVYEQIAAGLAKDANFNVASIHIPDRSAATLARARRAEFAARIERSPKQGVLDAFSWQQKIDMLAAVAEQQPQLSEKQKLLLEHVAIIKTYMESLLSNIGESRTWGEWFQQATELDGQTYARKEDLTIAIKRLDNVASAIISQGDIPSTATLDTYLEKYCGENYKFVRYCIDSMRGHINIHGTAVETAEQYEALIRGLRDNRDYGVARQIVEQVMAKEFKEGREKIEKANQALSAKVRRKAEVTINSKITEATLEQWEKEGMDEAARDKFRKGMIQLEYEKQLNTEVAEKLIGEKDGISVADGHAALWEQYKDMLDVKNEWLNVADTTWDKWADEIIVNAPLILISGGVTNLLLKGVSVGVRGLIASGRLARCGLVMTEVAEGARAVQATSRLGRVLLGSAPLAAGAAEGTLFELTHLGLQGEFLFNQPDWFQRIFWSSVTLGLFHGAGKVGEALLRTPIKDATGKIVMREGRAIMEPVMLGKLTAKVANSTVRKGIEELLIKGQLEVATMLLVGAIQHGAMNKLDYTDYDFIDSLIHSYIAIGALKIVGTAQKPIIEGAGKVWQAADIPGRIRRSAEARSTAETKARTERLAKGEYRDVQALETDLAAERKAAGMEDIGIIFLDEQTPVEKIAQQKAVLETLSDLGANRPRDIIIRLISDDIAPRIIKSDTNMVILCIAKNSTAEKIKTAFEMNRQAITCAQSEIALERALGQATVAEAVVFIDKDHMLTSQEIQATERALRSFGNGELRDLVIFVDSNADKATATSTAPNIIRRHSDGSTETSQPKPAIRIGVQGKTAEQITTEIRDVLKESYPERAARATEPQSPTSPRGPRFNLLPSSGVPIEVDGRNCHIKVKDTIVVKVKGETIVGKVARIEQARTSRFPVRGEPVIVVKTPDGKEVKLPVRTKDTWFLDSTETIPVFNDEATGAVREKCTAKGLHEKNVKDNSTELVYESPNGTQQVRIKRTIDRDSGEVLYKVTYMRDRSPVTETIRPDDLPKFLNRLGSEYDPTFVDVSAMQPGETIPVSVGETVEAWKITREGDTTTQDGVRGKVERIYIQDGEPYIKLEGQAEGIPIRDLRIIEIVESTPSRTKVSEIPDAERTALTRELSELGTVREISPEKITVNIGDSAKVTILRQVGAEGQVTYTATAEVKNTDGSTDTHTFDTSTTDIGQLVTDIRKVLPAREVPTSQDVVPDEGFLPVGERPAEAPASLENSAWRDAVARVKAAFQGEGGSDSAEFMQAWTHYKETIMNIMARDGARNITIDRTTILTPELIDAIDTVVSCVSSGNAVGKDVVIRPDENTSVRVEGDRVIIGLRNPNLINQYSTPTQIEQAWNTTFPRPAGEPSFVQHDELPGRRGEASAQPPERSTTTVKIQEWGTPDTLEVRIGSQIDVHIIGEGNRITAVRGIIRTITGSGQEARVTIQTDSGGEITVAAKYLRLYSSPPPEVQAETERPPVEDLLDGLVEPALAASRQEQGDPLASLVLDAPATQPRDKPRKVGLGKSLKISEKAKNSLVTKGTAAGFELVESGSTNDTLVMRHPTEGTVVTVQVLREEGTNNIYYEGSIQPQGSDRPNQTVRLAGDGKNLFDEVARLHTSREALRTIDRENRARLAQATREAVGQLDTVVNQGTTEHPVTNPADIPVREALAKNLIAQYGNDTAPVTITSIGDGWIYLNFGESSSGIQFTDLLGEVAPGWQANPATLAYLRPVIEAAVAVASTQNMERAANQ